MTGGITDISEFYRRHAPDVFRFALYLSGERSDAEDITSETFVRVWTASTPINEETVSAYLLTIARNLFLQAARKRKRAIQLEDHLLDPQPDPFERASAQSELDVVHERIMRLPQQDRSAFLMRMTEGMPYEEIARTLGISVASAKVKVHRARLTLSDIR